MRFLGTCAICTTTTKNYVNQNKYGSEDVSEDDAGDMDYSVEHVFGVPPSPESPGLRMPMIPSMRAESRPFDSAC